MIIKNKSKKLESKIETNIKIDGDLDKLISLFRNNVEVYPMLIVKSICNYKVKHEKDNE